MQQHGGAAGTEAADKTHRFMQNLIIVRLWHWVGPETWQYRGPSLFLLACVGLDPCMTNTETGIAC